jgi:5-methylcytosine-specific restriction protein A
MRFCLEPGCQKRTKNARCEDHERRTERQARGSATDRGYDWKWRTRALAFLARYPVCGARTNGQEPVMSRCYEAGRVVAARQVDHVVPHRGDQALFWDEENNWQALCLECGAMKSKAGL